MLTNTITPVEGNAPQCIRPHRMERHTPLSGGAVAKAHAGRSSLDGDGRAVILLGQLPL